MRGHVELRGAVAEHVGDEPRGEVEEEIAADRLQGAFDVQGVVEDAVADQVADLVVVGGFGEDALGAVAEGGAAVAAGGVLAVGDLQESDGLVGHGPHDPVQGPFPPAPFAARRAGGLLGVQWIGITIVVGASVPMVCISGDGDSQHPHSPGCRPYLSRAKRLGTPPLLVEISAESRPLSLYRLRLL